jgi:hypothetical protein
MTRSSLRGAIDALVLGAWIVLPSSDALAEDATSRLHLTYQAPSSCPSRDDFISALSPRIQESWIDGADTRFFEVRVVREGGTFAGELVIRQPGVPPNTRAIRGRSCSAVTKSLVVFLAIALDPISDPASNVETEPTGEADAPPTVETPREGGETPPAPPRPERPVPVTPRPRPRSPGVVWTWSSGLSAAHLRAPEPSWGGRVHAELSRSSELARIVPALRLSWGWSDFSTTPAQAGEVRFRLRSARVEAGARVSLGPCFAGLYLGLDVGSLTGTAPDLPRFDVVSAPWTAWTGAVRGGVTVAPWLTLELAAAALVPLERPRFDLREPPRVAYVAPAVLFEGSAGLVAVARFR